MEGLKSNQMTDGQGNAIRDYIWMGDIPVAMVDYTGVTERVTYLHADHLNTPRYATDETGNLVWQWSSDAFGNGAPNQDPDGDGTAITLNLRFPGQYFDAESGLHYNWNRYYDPAIGRYITSDPIGLDGGLNTFGYVGGNPVRFIDPFGLYWECSYWGLTNCREIPKVPVDWSVGVGGCSLTACANYNSKDGYTNITIPLIPEGGGGVSACYEPKVKEPNCEDDSKPTGTYTFGAGRYLGYSSDGNRNCFSLGFSGPSPINYHFNSGPLF